MKLFFEKKKEKVYTLSLSLYRFSSPWTINNKPNKKKKNKNLVIKYDIFDGF